MVLRESLTPSGSRVCLTARATRCASPPPPGGPWLALGAAAAVLGRLADFARGPSAEPREALHAAFLPSASRTLAGRGALPRLTPSTRSAPRARGAGPLRDAARVWRTAPARRATPDACVPTWHAVLSAPLAARWLAVASWRALQPGRWSACVVALPPQTAGVLARRRPVRAREAAWWSVCLLWRPRPFACGRGGQVAPGVGHRPGSGGWPCSELRSARRDERGDASCGAHHPQRGPRCKPARRGRCAGEQG